MDEDKIVELFNDTIHNTKAIYNKTQGFTKDIVYNWKKGITKPSLGDMLSILYQLNLIEVNEPNR
jgi:hypothetical protein